MFTEDNIDAIIEFIVFEYKMRKPDVDFFEFILTELKKELGDDYSFDQTRDIIRASSSRRMVKSIFTKGLGGLIK